MNVLTAATLACCGVAQADSLGCLIEPDRVADVGTQAVGVLARLSVERGDRVAAGQVLAYLTNQVERASVSVAEIKAKADAEVQQTQAAYELAQRKFERTRDLLKRDFVSDQAMDQAEAEARVAHQRVAQAKEAQRVAMREYQLTAMQLGQREVRSPFAGLVVERYRTEGERVEREPVVRVARVDPLRVEAIVPAIQFGTINAGQGATVKTDLPDFASLNATVTLVDRVLDPASNTFRVRLTLPNPGHKIPAGLRCRIAFGAKAPAGSGQLAPGAPAPSAPRLTPSSWGVGGPKEPAAESKAGSTGTLPLLIKPAQPARPGPSPEMPAPPMQAHMPAPRIMSSTLRVAMTQLGRMTPGAKWLSAPNHTQSAQARASARARLPATTYVLARSLSLPGQAPVAVAEVVVPGAPIKGRTATERMAKASPGAGDGVNLASVR